MPGFVPDSLSMLRYRHNVREDYLASGPCITHNDWSLRFLVVDQKSWLIINWQNTVPAVRDSTCIIHCNSPTYECYYGSSCMFAPIIYIIVPLVLRVHIAQHGHDGNFIVNDFGAAAVRANKVVNILKL